MTETQIQTLQALCDRIIPADDYPSAWEAGAGDYISRLLETDCRDLLPLYQDGLDALNAEAQALTGNAFAALAPEPQDALLKKVEMGDVQTAWNTAPTQFFRTIIHHTAESYYADPGNGGNRNARSWEMIGF